MRVPFRDVALDALLEEREHLKIRLSLLDDPDVRTWGSAETVRAELAALEARIARHRAAG